MDLPWNDIATAGTGGGVAVITMMAVYFGAKYLRTKNGQQERLPEAKAAPRCVAEPVLTDVRVQSARQEEGFKGLCHSIDGMAQAVRDNAQETKAVVGSLVNAYLGEKKKEDEG